MSAAWSATRIGHGLHRSSTNWQSPHTRSHRLLRLMLLICSFQVRSAFPPRCRNLVSQFHFQPTKASSSYNLELWHMTLTYENDLDRVKVNHHDKYFSHSSFRSIVIVRKHIMHTQWTGNNTTIIEQYNYWYTCKTPWCRTTLTTVDCVITEVPNDDFMNQFITH